MSDIRMDAYYYGFDKTNVDCIDELLSSVAYAGKAFHHTEEWMEEASAYGEHTIGKTPIDWIQNSAIKAAKEITALRQQLAEQPKADVLVEALKFYANKNHMSLDGTENGVIALKALATYQAKKE